jgi:hypothetical protein
MGSCHNTEFDKNFTEKLRPKISDQNLIQVSTDFNRVFIDHVYDILNRLTSQSQCVEYRWISMDEVTDYDNWILLTPGQTCATPIGLPGNAEG